MRASAHRLTGLCAGACVCAALWPHPLAWTAVPAGLIGGNAPDRLEWLGERRWCVHRTITHWFVLWAAAFIAGGWALAHGQPWAPALTGYAAGGLTHLLFDVPNPTGVPVFWPRRRIAFRWWRSGDHDFLLILASLSLTGLAILARVRG